MTKRKVFRKSNKAINIFADGGNPGSFNFNSFMNSGAMQNFGKMASMFNQFSQQGNGNSQSGSFLAANQSVHGSGTMGAIGSAIDSTGQILSAIDNMTTKKRKPLDQTVGLVSSDGRRLFAVGGYANMATTAMALAGNAVQQAKIEDTTDLKNQINQYGDKVVSASNYDDLLNDWSSRTELQHISAKDLRNKSYLGDFANSLSASAQGMSAGSSAGPIGAAVGGILGGVSSVIGSWIGRNKAKRESKRLNQQIDIANAKNLESYDDRIENIETQQDLNALANYSAYGGNIDIANSKKGTFTAAAKRHDKGVQEFATQVLANKENYSPTMVKKANFARNAAKWKHAEGGTLSTQGGDFNNGITFIGNGGTHEENPFEGVQIGVDQEGVPNLVEEGEVIYNNDYIFSNRLTANKQLLKSVNLPTSYNNHSFAAIAEKLSKESSERPNDPISKRGLNDSMMRLKQAQEALKLANEMKAKYKSSNNKFDEGGPKTPTFEDSLKTNYDTLLSRANSNLRDSTDITFDIEDEQKNKPNWSSLLRYAPVVGSAMGLGHDLLSKPDYSGVDTLMAAADSMGNYQPINYDPLGNYLQYTPLDRNYYINNLNAQANATRRAILNSSSPARNAALLAADYNAQGKLGALARQAEEYNLAQRQAVEQFNRGTNQANSEMGLKTAMANLEAQQKAKAARASLLTQALSLKDSIDTRRGASISSNMTNFFNSLGDIGREEVMKSWINENPALAYAISIGNDGVSYKRKSKSPTKKSGKKYLTIKSKD